MYRAITWLALDDHPDLPGDETLAALAQGASIRLERGPDGSPVLYLNGEDVTPHLRKPHIDHDVPRVSEVPGVRRAMVPHQRAMAAEGRLVMVGRDIGSEVLTDAPLKVYLTASPAERARRRHAELAARGDTRSYEQILEEVLDRDHIDMNREVSPLLPPRLDALPPATLLLETDNLTEDEVVERLYDAASL